MLKRLLSIGLVIIVSGCSFVNKEQFAIMYSDSMGDPYNTNYANYQDKSLTQSNREINDMYINELVKRVSATPLIFTDEQFKNIDKAINKFRDEKLDVTVVDVKENSGRALFNVIRFNVYDEFLKSVNSNNIGVLDAIAFTKLVETSIISAFNNCEMIDIDQVKISVKEDKKYYISNSDQRVMIKRIVDIE